MANIQGQKKWSEVRLLETHELARGGINGNLNEQAKALADRTELLMQEKASKSEIANGFREYATYAAFWADLQNVPVNSTVVIGEENTTGTGTWGIGNNRWDGATLSKSPFDPVTQAKDAIPLNLLFDPFSETVDATSKNDTLQGYKNAEFSNKLASSANSYFGKPTLHGAASQRVARYIDAKKLGLDVGHSFFARVKAFFDGVDGTSRITVASYKADGTVIQTSPKLPITGINDVISDAITITSDTAYIGILLPSATNKELIATSFSILSRPKFIYGAQPSSVAAGFANSLAVVSANTAANTAAISANTNALASVTKNLMPDAFFRLYSAGINEHDGYAFMQSEVQVIDFPQNPFPSKKALRIKKDTEYRKRVSLKGLALRVGDTLTLKVGVVSDTNSSLRFDLYARKDTATILTSNWSIESYVANAYKEASATITITQDVFDQLQYLEIRINGNPSTATGDFNVCGLGLIKNNAISPLVDTSYEEDKQKIEAIKGYAKNLIPDPFFRSFKNGIVEGDYPLFNESGWSLVEYANSPFSTKHALYCTTAQKHRNISLKALGLKAGDTLNFKVGMVLPDGGIFGVGAFIRDSSNTVIGTANNVRPLLAANTYTEVTNSITVTQAMLDNGVYLQIRFNIDSTVFVNGYYVLAQAIYVNSQYSVIRDTTYAEDNIRKEIKAINDYLNEVPFMYGTEFLRQTHQRMRKLLMGEDRQLIVYNIGDSWSHNRRRWTGPVHAEMLRTLGDGGGGWCGFGFQTENIALNNGNIRESYGYTWDVGKWTGNYGFSHSPDICQADSNVVGAKITCTSPAAGPTVSGIDLFYIGGSGVIRYQFNGGAWTTFNLNAITSGDLGVTALTGFAANNNTLVIEVVSGSVSLCGINWKSSENGVVWHKTGASGSLASRWADSDKPNWIRGVAALNPHLVTIFHGVNDQIGNKRIDQFDYALNTLVDNVHAAAPYADILIISPCMTARETTSDVPMREYTKVAYNVARKRRCAFVNCQPAFGQTFEEYMAGSFLNYMHEDGIHPNLGGIYGDVLTDLILRILYMGIVVHALPAP